MVMPSAGPTTPTKKARKSGSSQATKIVDILINNPNLELFHDEKGIPWATYGLNGHLETVSMRSKVFRSWMSLKYYEKFQSVPGSSALEAALTVLCGKAVIHCSEKKVFLRRGMAGKNLYIDLCNDDRQVVEITPSGWKVIQDPPVPFIRKKGGLPLPVPVPGGSLADHLVPFFPVYDDHNLYLLIAWLLAAYSDGPYPVLTLVAEQGNGKSTLTRALRSLLDPNEADIRAKPRDERDLMIQAGNSWVMAYDNLSSISDWLSDAFCRLSTGGGWTTRSLYSDDEEMIINAKRPVILNGISDIVTRGDLLSRALIVNLPVIPDIARKPEKEYWQEFHQVRPLILGALFDTVSNVLLNLPSVIIDELPRMADFAEWVTAAEPFLNIPKGGFLSAINTNAENASLAVLEDSLLATEIVSFSKGFLPYEGTAQELHRMLISQTLGDPQRAEFLNKLRPHSLGNELRRLAPILRTHGIDVNFDPNSRKRGKKERLITITQNVNVKANVSVP